MRPAAILLSLAVACALSAQAPPQNHANDFELGKLTAVAVGVKDVTWEPGGAALIYDAKDADGDYQGAYRTDGEKGRPVLRLPKGTQVMDRSWLPRRQVLVEILESPIREKALQRWSVVAIDAQNFKSHELLSLNYPEKESVRIDLDVSPLLDHGLVTVRDSKGSRVYVLLTGNGSFVLSSDIAAARAQGSGFLGWSADGTAYFSAPGSPVPNDSNSFVIDSSVGKSIGDKFGTLTLTISGDDSGGLLVNGGTLKIKLAPARIAPSAGTPVLEVMPWNGSLRPVRSRGPFEEPNTILPPIEPRGENAQVVSGLRKGSSGALWLVSKSSDAKNPPPAAESLLIAPEARESWLSPKRNWVAYQTAGALFVREIRARE